MEKKNETILNETIPQRYGFIALLDALGTKNFTEKQEEDFIRSRNFIESTNVELLDFLVEQNQKVFDKYNLNPKEILDVFIFQDTILFSCETKTIEASLELIPFIAEFINHFFIYSLKQNIRLRGAISLGNYRKSNNIYLGQAVNDASNWYDKADWMGILFTPNVGMHLDFIYSNPGYKKILMQEYLDTFVTKYPYVPIKEKSKDMWICNWAKTMEDQSPKPDFPIAKDSTIKELYYKLMSFSIIDFGTEIKYENTNKYFDWAIEKYNLHEMKIFNP